MTASQSTVETFPAGAGLFALVLAAGLSTRFGSPKQLADVQGQAMVARAMRAAESVFGPRTVLVAGNEWPAVTAAAGRLAGYLVINNEFRRGLGSSIAAGVAAVADCSRGVMLLLADQPLVDASYLRQMADTWQRDPQRIVASEYRGVTGPPVIFPASCFDELRAQDGEHGARQVIRSNAALLTTLDCVEAAVDIDYREDLEKLADRPS